LEYYSLLIDLNYKNVLVVGKYRILEFKIEKLIEAGAKIRYISDSLSPNLKQHVESGQLVYINDKYNDSHLEDVWLVICGSDDSNLKKQIEHATSERHIFCNFVDEPIPSSFISPAIIKKGDIIISVSTKGKSPSLNRFLKKQIDEFIGDEYQHFAELLGNIREKVLKNIPFQRRRAEIFDSIVQNPKIWELIKKNNLNDAEKLIHDIVDSVIKDQK
jgi:siroheme synthase-like protein